MLRIHCQGCGLSEELDSDQRTIAPVSLLDRIDSRSWTTDPNYTADLCRECLEKLLHNYFGISAEGRLEVPTFIETQSLRVVGQW